MPEKVIFYDGFEDGVVGWTPGTNTTLNHITGNAFAGNSYMELRRSATGGVTQLRATRTVTGFTPGRAYVLSFAVSRDSGSAGSAVYGIEGINTLTWAQVSVQPVWGENSYSFIATAPTHTIILGNNILGSAVRWTNWDEVKIIERPLAYAIGFEDVSFGYAIPEVGIGEVGPLTQAVGGLPAGVSNYSYQAEWDENPEAYPEGMPDTYHFTFALNYRTNDPDVVGPRFPFVGFPDTFGVENVGFEHRADGTLIGWIGNQTVSSGPGTIQEGVTHQLALTSDGATVKMYVDAVEVASGGYGGGFDYLTELTYYRLNMDWGLAGFQVDDLRIAPWAASPADLAFWRTVKAGDEEAGPTPTPVITRTADAKLRLGATATRTVRQARTATAVLGLSAEATAVPVEALARTAQATLALSATAESTQRLETTSQATLALGASAETSVVLSRSAQATMALGASAEVAQAFAVEATATLGLGATATRTITAVRTAATELRLSASVATLQTFVREAEAVLRLDATASADRPGEVIERTANAVLSLGASATTVICQYREASATLGLTAYAESSQSYALTALARLRLGATAVTLEAREREALATLGLTATADSGELLIATATATLGLFATADWFVPTGVVIPDHRTLRALTRTLRDVTATRKLTNVTPKRTLKEGRP